MSAAFIKLKTTEHTDVLIRKEHVSAIEFIPGKGGLEPSVKLYVNGYSFKVQGEMEPIVKALNISTEEIDKT
jgi:hypothetical protein